jgi:hypothetical protein
MGRSLLYLNSKLAALRAIVAVLNSKVAVLRAIVAVSNPSAEGSNET